MKRAKFNSAYFGFFLTEAVEAEILTEAAASVASYVVTGLGFSRK